MKENNQLNNFKIQRLSSSVTGINPEYSNRLVLFIA